ncbi:NAD(P)H-hydrate repair enzyme Nnr NAD(P)H-hydrate dehydratase domain [Methanonatronarchaeum thermophilum]|uniref:Bifunctional NAD(P)H-hydrate repair enzyme n=1 Tax=Methanonatronarchaeum thermophilum TaxID=1927129 RepID=A0A1Y3GFN7_9EURY|nr:NAD(P)H-hydrate dehydratase [Methanonatronarchaeum thermophilum]OUJ18265.1 NAD(P)H-hydrate repair enzyme Nnr NAD(P)H-hydrate dehydratase domain [Methanonatronarchaeum thermophilum]
MISSLDMKALDRNAHYYGVPPRKLMEEAGRQTALQIEKEPKKNIAVIAGKGNNGGDGFVTARYLKEMGHEVEVLLVGNAKNIKTGPARENWLLLKRKAIKTTESNNPEYFQALEINSDIIIDAILGIGIKGKPREPIQSAIKAINKSKAKKISIDVPTGINPDTGKGEREGEYVKPDKTVTFHKPKKGLPNAKTVKIGIPKKAETHAGPGDLLYLNKRKENSHKGQNGKLLIIGGGEYTGAPALTAQAALRAGADLTTIITTKTNKDIIAGYSPNLIVKGIDNYKKLTEINENKYDAAVIGPGIGEKHHEEINKHIKQTKLPTVLDADGINAIKNPKTLKNKIITPHNQEYKNLFNQKPTKQNIQKNAKKHRCIILKKGATDIITDGEQTKQNPAGTPAMTVGGTGDVLAGVTGALLSQNTKKPYRAAVAAAFITGKTGEHTAKKYGNGLLPTDIIKQIPQTQKKYQ